MFDKKDISDLAKKLRDALPAGITQLPKDLEKNFQAILQSAFHKMNLVTREEFDAQTKVLQRTRAKLEQLEKQIKKLEDEA